MEFGRSKKSTKDKELASRELISFHGFVVRTAVGFCQVPVRFVDIPLSLGVTGVVAHRGRGVHAKLGHEASANIVVVKISAEAELFQLDFFRAKDFPPATD